MIQYVRMFAISGKSQLEGVTAISKVQDLGFNADEARTRVYRTTKLIFFGYHGQLSI